MAPGSRRRPAAAAALAAFCGLVPAAAQGPPPGLPVSRLEQQQPTGLPSLPVTQLEDRARPHIDGPSRLTMDFPRPMAVREVLQLLVAGTPFSVVIDPGVTTTFAGTLKDVTMRQALESVLVPLNLDYAIDGTVIRVFVRRPATRLFDVNFVGVQRSIRRGLRGAVAVQGEPATVSATVSADVDHLTELVRGVEALLSATGRAHVDRAAGVVQVTDFADRLEEIGIYLETVQLRATRQVRIDAHLIEVTMHDAARATIDWAAVAATAGIRTAGSATSGFKVPDMNALLDAIRGQGSVATLAAPRVLAMNNEPAVMRVGTQLVSFDTASTLARNDGRPPAPATPVFAGLTLVVTPQIASDGIVQISVSPTLTEKTADVRAPAGGSVPVLTIAEADTVVRVQEGETVVISGLIQDRTRVKKAAGVGGVFGAQTRETVKSELVILLTPTVVVPGSATGGGQ